MVILARLVSCVGGIAVLLILSSLWLLSLVLILVVFSKESGLRR